MKDQISRRDFFRTTAAAAGAVTVGMGGNFVAAATDKAAIEKTRSYNPNMEYRRLGSTGIWASAICLGGHFKRVGELTGHTIQGWERPTDAAAIAALDKNRDAVIGKCIDVGINLIDACTTGEVATYGPLLQGSRREKIYLNAGAWPECPRDPKWRTKEKLMESLEMNLKDGKQEYFDIWRVVMDDRGRHSDAENDVFAATIEEAKKAGKIRFGGASCHSHRWLEKAVTKYPGVFQVMIFPYTVKTQELPKSSLFEAVRKYDIGTLGIKPFGSNSLFHGAADAEEKSRRARMTLRYILGNPAITAPIPGLAIPEEVENAALAVKEMKKQLSYSETKELMDVTENMYANLTPQYEWLKDWQYV